MKSVLVCGMGKSGVGRKGAYGMDKTIRILKWPALRAIV